MCVNAARVKNTRPIEQLLEPVKLAHPTLFSGITLADRQRYKESSLYTTYVLPLTTLFYMQYGLALERRIAAAEHRSDGKSVLAIPADPQGWLEQGVRHVLNASNSGERTWRALHAEVDKVRAAHPDIFAPVEAPGSKIRTFKPFVDILLPVAYEVYRRMLAPLRERCLALGVSDALIEQ